MWATREVHDLELRQFMKGMTAEDCPLTAPEKSPPLRGDLGGPSPYPSQTERVLVESLHKGQLDLSLTPSGEE